MQKYAYREVLRDGLEVDLDELRKRIIQSLYAAAVRDERYPVAKPTLKLRLGNPASFSQPYPEVVATVEAL